MDYIDKLKDFSARVAQLSKVIQSEEATKNALILPFFQMLGYDVFNPMEFVPEYTADVGIKKGEKVDYAVVIDGVPMILIEAKWCGESLESHDSQLFRYFAASAAKLAILTNGIVYRFYTDLDEPNKMDLTPFMEFNILDIKENLIPELKRFQRTALDVGSIFNAASDLKYMTAVKQLIAREAANPSDGFLSFVIKEVYSGRRTVQVTEKFHDISKRAFAQYINEIMNERLKSVLDPAAKLDMPSPAPAQPSQEPEAEPAEEEVSNGIHTTSTELEAYIIIKTLLHDTIEAGRVTYKDTRSYFSILIDGKTTRWVCRLQLEGKKQSVIIPDADGKETRYYINTSDDIMQYRDSLVKRSLVFA